MTPIRPPGSGFQAPLSGISGKMHSPLKVYPLHPPWIQQEKKSKHTQRNHEHFCLHPGLIHRAPS